MDLIHHCPKCFYNLVLIERRGKYKCAECSSLYPQRFIEDKDFRAWNEKQRLLEKEELKKIKVHRNRKPRIKLSEEERKRRDKVRREKYYEKNKPKIIELFRRWREKNRDYYNQKNREWYWEDVEKSRYQSKLRQLRRRQKEITLERLENLREKPSSEEILISFPT